MLRKQVVLMNKGELTYIFRYGLVVRISGSHPGGPGSIPGNGIFFSLFLLKFTAFVLEPCWARTSIELDIQCDA